MNLETLKLFWSKRSLEQIKAKVLRSLCRAVSAVAARSVSVSLFLWVWGAASQAAAVPNIKPISSTVADCSEHRSQAVALYLSAACAIDFAGVVRRWSLPLAHRGSRAYACSAKRAG